MITVTLSKTDEADRIAAQRLEARVREAADEGLELDPYTQMMIHKMAWASVTGADVVRVKD